VPDKGVEVQILSSALIFSAKNATFATNIDFWIFLYFPPWGQNGDSIGFALGLNRWFSPVN